MGALLKSLVRTFFGSYFKCFSIYFVHVDLLIQNIFNKAKVEELIFQAENLDSFLLN